MQHRIFSTASRTSVDSTPGTIQTQLHSSRTEYFHNNNICYYSSSAFLYLPCISERPSLPHRPNRIICKLTLTISFPHLLFIYKHPFPFLIITFQCLNTISTYPSSSHKRYFYLHIFNWFTLLLSLHHQKIYRLVKSIPQHMPLQRFHYPIFTLDSL